MKTRKISSMMSRDEKRLIYMLRIMHPYARGLLVELAVSFVEVEREWHRLPPANVLMFPHTETTGRAATLRTGRGKGRMPPSRPDAS